MTYAADALSWGFHSRISMHVGLLPLTSDDCCRTLITHADTKGEPLCSISTSIPMDVATCSHAMTTLLAPAAWGGIACAAVLVRVGTPVGRCWCNQAGTSEPALAA